VQKLYTMTTLPKVTKTHNVKSKRTISKDKSFWEQHGVVLTSENGHQRVILNSIPVGNSRGEIELYLFPADKKS